MTFIPNCNANRVESGLLRCFLLNIKELNISLRLPLAAYEASQTTGQSSVGSPPVSTWTELPYTIERFEKLNTLRIWLDHDQACSWSMINERAVVSPLAYLSADLDVSINLPKLHPKFERPDWHFMEDKAQPPLVIHRRFRQREHVKECGDGSLVSYHEPDFPISYALEHFHMDIEDVEANERRAWKEGEDPPQVLYDKYPDENP